MKLHNLFESDNLQGVAEGTNDTIYPNAEVIKSRNGKPVGEIYQDENGWGCFHYKADNGADSIESREEALEWLKDIAEEYRQDRNLREQGVAEGEVVQFPKKHKGDLDKVQDCPKCGGDLQGGTYMGHKVKVCMPCKQVYLPPNSGIDQKGNKIVDEMDGDGSGRDGSNRKRISSYGTRDRDDVGNGPDIHLGAEHTMKPKEITKKAQDLLNKAYGDETSELARKAIINKKVHESELDEKSVSQAQFRTMAAAAHNPEFAKKVGISGKVAREFHKADKGANYKKLPKKVSETRAYYNVIGTPEPQLRSEFGMRKDRNGWFLSENVDKRKQMAAFRAFGAPKLKEWNQAAFSGSANIQGEDNIISPVGSGRKGK